MATMVGSLYTGESVYLLTSHSRPDGQPPIGNVVSADPVDSRFGRQVELRTEWHRLSTSCTSPSNTSTPLRSRNGRALRTIHLRYCSTLVRRVPMRPVKCSRGSLIAWSFNAHKGIYLDTWSDCGVLGSLSCAGRARSLRSLPCN